MLLARNLTSRLLRPLIRPYATVGNAGGDEKEIPVPRLVLTKEQHDTPEPKLHPILSGTGAMLHVVLPPGSTLSCKAHTIVGRSTTVTVDTELAGGPVRAMSRGLAGGPFAVQKLSAVGGIGDALIAPVNIGQVVVADLDGSSDLYLRRNSFVASTDGISIRTRLQRLSEAGVTGLFLLKAAGVGKVAITGYGSVAEISLRKFEEYIVSARHVVAWDGSMRTSPVKKSGNWFTRLLVGESVQWRITGPGRVYVKSRVEPRSWFQTKERLDAAGVQSDAANDSEKALASPGSESQPIVTGKIQTDAKATL